jgi:hypothetical protein
VSGSLDALAGRVRRELVDLQAVAGRALRIWGIDDLPASVAGLVVEFSAFADTLEDIAREG